MLYEKVCSWSSKQRSITLNKMWKFFLSHLFQLCTTASYCLEHNGIIYTTISTDSNFLPARWHQYFETLFQSVHRSYRLSRGYVGEYKCTVIGLCFQLYLWILYKLRGRIQVYCDRSLFTTLSMVALQASYIGEYKCTVIGLCFSLYLWILYKLRGRIQVYRDRSLFTTLSMISLQAT